MGGKKEKNNQKQNNTPAKAAGTPAKEDIAKWLEQAGHIDEAELTRREAAIEEKEKNIERLEKAKADELVRFEEAKAKELEKFVAAKEKELEKLKRNNEEAERTRDILKEKQDKQDAQLAEEKRKAEAKLQIEIEEEKTKLLGNLMSDTQKKLDKQREEADAYSKETRENADKYAKETRAAANKDAEEARAAANKDAKETREGANKDAEDIRSKANEDAKEKMAEALEKYGELSENAAKANFILQKEQLVIQREENLDEAVNERYRLELERYNSDIASMKEELENRLNENVKLKKQLFGQEEIDKIDPTVIKNQLEDLRNKNVELEKALSSRQSELDVKCKEQEEEIKALKAEKTDLNEKNKTLQNNAEKVDELKEQVSLLEREKELWKIKANEHKELIDRFITSKEQMMSTRDERIAEIKRGGLTEAKCVPFAKDMTELNWLKGIYKNCDDFGIHFPKRILYAFHTALKISDWSIITVLAGVSGTGKSELPNLYAAFGGMNISTVPVQPDWDSQESMLGFFNSIDNRFEPTPLLRFLAECTENADKKVYGDGVDDDPEMIKDVNDPGNYMNIVLLDEMNLAHVEYYFANFLSKLETRREHNITMPPKIEVKLGAGLEPYELKLTRNILWAGTMNQDETTKSLSDKVLDRGIVINFPRPTSLKSREKMSTLEKAVKRDEMSRRNMLTRTIWGAWIIRNIDKLEKEAAKYVREVLEEFRHLVEDINKQMGTINRGIGHRVWQSIEFYIINYPTVIEAANGFKDDEKSRITLRENMRTAFEDQIVQKIMPKLRGVETSGSGGKCLDEIEKLLANDFGSLLKDFATARAQGYGQFIWCSAEYISDDENKTVASDMESVPKDDQKDTETNKG